MAQGRGQRVRPPDQMDAVEGDRLSLLASIVESSDDAIIAKSLDGIITSWNSAAANMYGYSSEEIIGKPITIITHEDHVDEMGVILGKIRDGQRLKHYETLRVRKDGSVIPVSLTVSPIRDADGAIIGASSIARDITDRKRIVTLEAVNEAMRNFVAVAAHDLRSPLAAIVGFSTHLNQNWVSISEQDRQKFAATIDRQAHNLSRLVDDLFTLSSIEGGALSTRPELIVLRDAIDQCLEAGGEHATSVSVSCSPQLVVRVDPHHLGRMLDNYLQNAFKYGQPPVRIDASRVDDMVEVRVLDHGAGVPEEFVARLFGKFARADTSGTRAENGTGLGLSIVRGLAEVNGGQAYYEPKAPSGGCFVVRLPAGDRPKE